MKKIITLFAFLFIGFSAAFADEYVISKVNCVSADVLYDRILTLKYDDEDKIYYFCQADYSSVYWFTLSEEKLNKIRMNLTKTKEWEKLAKEKKSSISKELPDSQIKVSGTMNRGNNWYTTRWDIGLNFFFVSYIEEDAEVISLLLRGGEEESRQNEFVDIEFESIVFLNSEIDDFIQAISEKTIKTAIEEHEQKKKEADMFN